MVKNLVFPRIFLYCVSLPDVVSGLLLSGRSEVRIPSGVPGKDLICRMANQVFSMISVPDGTGDISSI